MQDGCLLTDHDGKLCHHQNHIQRKPLFFKFSNILNIALYDILLNGAYKGFILSYVTRTSLINTFTILYIYSNLDTRNNPEWQMNF